ncbi:MAG: NAD-dependent epimerase/dehydratase family protein [Pseudomonadota bacterium]
MDGRILVVGAGGFIGRHVSLALKQKGADVVGLDLAAAPQELVDVPWIIGNAADPALVSAAAAGCGSVVFLANHSLPNTSNFDLAAEIGAHVVTTIKSAEVCAEQGVKRFVFASSGGTVYGSAADLPLSETAPTKPRNAYGVSKLSIEHYLRLIRELRDMVTVSLRISNPYGEGQMAVRNQGFIASAMQHVKSGTTMPIWGDGSVERDFIHVSDVAQAFLSALEVENPPESVNVGSGQAHSLLDILGQISGILGREVPVAFEPGRQIDTSKNVLDIGRAQGTLGWKPVVPLGVGLRRTADWWGLTGHGGD